MGLNYTDGCVNFRDIGAYINLILEKEVLVEGVLYRGGSIDYVETHEEIESVKSIINLRNGEDNKYFPADYFHFPMSNKVEKYDTTQKEVQIWINSIVKLFENEEMKFPILIHCLSGKDRTGIVVSALLLILGMEEDIIEEEYLLSEGEVKSSLIRASMQGMLPLDKYFDRIDLPKIRANLWNVCRLTD